MLCYYLLLFRIDGKSIPWALVAMNQSVYKKDLRPSKQFEAVILLSQVLEAFLLYWRISSSPVKNNNCHVRYFRLFSFLFLYQESEDVFLFISGIGGRFSFIPGGCCFLHHILEAVSSFTPWCWSLFSLLQNWRLFYISDSDTGHHRTRKRDSGHSTDWTVGIGQRH